MSSDSSRKCAVVTGGAGFIGSHLVDLLLKEGHCVTVIDNFATGRLENIAHHNGNEKFKLIRADVIDLQTILPIFHGVDWVFHLAALADIVASIERPIDYHHSNVDGTIAVLEASRQNNIKRFVYTASSSCYGIPKVYPTPENTEICPMYPYALTKFLGEEMVLHWDKVYKMPCVSLRLFNVYGPRARTTGTYGAVFGVFLAQKLAGKPFTIVGDGTQTRDFTYVSDVADAFLKAADSNQSGEVFNIGSGGTYSVNQIVEILEGKSVYLPKRPGEPDCTFADISKAVQDLSWTPCISFKDGVKKMLDQIEYWRTAPVWDPDSIAKATSEWFKYLGDKDIDGKGATKKVEA